MVVGLISLAVVFGLRVIAPRVPGALVLVVGGLAASRVFDLGVRGVALVGPVPRGLPSFQVPDLHLAWHHAGVLAAAAVALVLIGFSQTAGDARAFAAKHSDAALTLPPKGYVVLKRPIKLAENSLA